MNAGAAVRAGEPTRAELALYRFCRAAVVGACRVLWCLRVEGREHVPDGAFVLAPVHRSNIDTPVVGGVTKRRLRYMGKDTMWKHRAPGWLFSALGAFPVRRGSADREALRRCLEVLRGGEPLVVFPEGGRRSGPVVGPLHEGAAYLAIRAGVPIVPVGIGGSEKALPRGAKRPHRAPVRAVVGAPLFPPASAPTSLTEGAGEAGTPSRRAGSRRAVHELTEELRRELQRLFDQAQLKAGA